VPSATGSCLQKPCGSLDDDAGLAQHRFEHLLGNMRLEEE
jgi:hypothetical protein